MFLSFSKSNQYHSSENFFVTTCFLNFPCHENFLKKLFSRYYVIMKTDFLTSIDKSELLITLTYNLLLKFFNIYAIENVSKNIQFQFQTGRCIIVLVILAFNATLLWMCPCLHSNRRHKS